MPLDIELLREPIVIYGLIVVGLIIYRQPLTEWLQRKSRMLELAATGVGQLRENLDQWHVTNAEVIKLRRAAEETLAETRMMRAEIEALRRNVGDGVSTLHRMSERLAVIEGRKSR
ncbi:hypothetical protein [Oceanicella actignis]|uniref:hypothetical protein n=1 Tax=Oceanicella actignis TaxID=1189325 RepID=UPI0011E86CCC|nr:hypothetical protein [Oceanicella actignis]TYO91423.1 hypothetical protein LY05_00276 [Oceanicella actignis]